jgi:hypothetical protein
MYAYNCLYMLAGNISMPALVACITGAHDSIIKSKWSDDGFDDGIKLIPVSM